MLIQDEDIRSRAAVNPNYPYVCHERRKSQRGTAIIWVIRQCEDHGGFDQTLSRIERGDGCPGCVLVTDEDIRSRAAVNPNYPYVRHARRKESRGFAVIWVIRKCENHGEFDQALFRIEKGQGCPECAGASPVTDEDIRSRAAVNPNYPYVHHERRKNSQGNSIIWVIRQCEDHGEFDQRLPVIESHRQGCPGCAIGGFDPTEPGILYYLRLDTPDGMLYKIGITNRTVMERYPSPGDQSLIKIVHGKRFEVGAEAHAAEQQIIADNIDHQYHGEWRFADGTGGRELFVQEINMSSLFQ